VDILIVPCIQSTTQIKMQKLPATETIDYQVKAAKKSLT